MEGGGCPRLEGSVPRRKGSTPATGGRVGGGWGGGGGGGIQRQNPHSLLREEVRKGGEDKSGRKSWGIKSKTTPGAGEKYLYARRTGGEQGTSKKGSRHGGAQKGEGGKSSETLA